MPHNTFCKIYLWRSEHKSFHRICLASPSLSIGQNASIIAFQNIFHDWMSHLLKDLLLPTLGAEHMVKWELMHVEIVNFWNVRFEVFRFDRFKVVVLEGVDHQIRRVYFHRGNEFSFKSFTFHEWSDPNCHWDSFYWRLLYSLVSHRISLFICCIMWLNNNGIIFSISGVYFKVIKSSWNINRSNKYINSLNSLKSIISFMNGLLNILGKNWDIITQ